jgi:hypothetical protein
MALLLLGAVLGCHGDGDPPQGSKVGYKQMSLLIGFPQVQPNEMQALAYFKKDLFVGKGAIHDSP